MITKKDIPLNLLKAIEGIAQSNLDIIQLKREDNTFYCFVETDNKSNNYFKIFIDGSKQFRNLNTNAYAFERKPANADKTIHQKDAGSLQSVITSFEAWIKIIRDIYDTPSVHDDNFVRKYSDFYYNEFKIVDEDANISPFNPDQQDLIDLYLDSLTNAIQNYNEKIDDIVKAELISEIQEIKTTLPTSTKNKVMKSITRIFGKLYKISKPLTKEVVKEAGKYLIKKLFDLGVEYAPKILKMLSDNINI